MSLPGGHKERFYNPISQNRGHIKWLGKFLEDSVPLFSVIVFSERCELKKATVAGGDVLVIKRSRLYATVRNVWDASPDVLDGAAVEDLFNRLQPLTNVGKDVKSAHVAHIEKQYKRDVEKSSSPSACTEESKTAASEGAEICPKCGGKLILRTAKKGANAGNQFYGCRRFPRCRYIRNI